MTDAETWRTKRRPEILRLFEANVYGKTPAGRPKEMSFEVTSIDKNALGGKAIRKEVSIYFTGKKDGPKMDLLIYLPANAKGKVPVFLVPNFNGNHAVHSDPGITLSTRWMRAGPGIVKNRATGEARRVSTGDGERLPRFLAGLRGACGGGTSVESLQPVIPVWRRGNGQDPPDAGHRA